MKSFISNILFLALVCLSTSFSAVADVPHATTDGTDTQLSAADIATLQSWIQQSSYQLRDAQDEVVNSLNPAETKKVLIDAIRKVVPESMYHGQETLLRYALNRALKIETALESSGSSSQPEIINQELRVLRQSISIALRFVPNDIDFFNHPTSLMPYGVFAVEEADALLWINESELDSQVQLSIALDVVGWMHVDLARDPNVDQFASAISRIDNLLKHSDNLKNSPVSSMKKIRKVYFQALTDLMKTDTPVGRRIREIQMQNLGPKADKRIVL